MCKQTTLHVVLCDVISIGLSMLFNVHQTRIGFKAKISPLGIGRGEKVFIMKCKWETAPKKQIKLENCIRNEV